jgi:Domain of unknown function (DUF1707)
MPEPHLRASDMDRAAVATALGQHMAAGRLTLAEYEERLTQAYATKTLGGLATLTADLPAPAPVAVTAPVPARHPAPARGHACGQWSASARSPWVAWTRTALIVLTIWTLTAIATGTAAGFWPIWVIGPWGAVLLARTLTGGGRGQRPRERQRIRV